jgi:hypothetical protein
VVLPVLLSIGYRATELLACGFGEPLGFTEKHKDPRPCGNLVEYLVIRTKQPSTHAQKSQKKNTTATKS